MPKNLSLKKAQQSIPLKRQKAITQFFKTDHDVQKHNNLNLRDEGKPTGTNGIDISSNKRKAMSPVSNVNSVEEQDTMPKKSKFALKCTSQNDGNIIKKSSPKKNNENSTEKDFYFNPLKIELCKPGNLETTENKCCRSPLSKIDNGESLGKLTPKSSPMKFENNYVNKDCVSSKEILKNDHDNYIHSFISSSHLCISQEIQSSLTTRQAKNNCRSPSSIKTTKKLSVLESSPSKTGSTVKVFHFSHEEQKEVGDIFADEWEINDEYDMDDLDLSIMQRCEVLNLVQHSTQIEMRLKNSNNNRGTCFIEGFWVDTPLCPGDIVGVIASRDSLGKFCVNNTSGLLVLHPDYLVSSTSVVAGVFCKRKAVLQERYRGIDSANAAMTIGILVHELVQKALMQNIFDINELHLEAERIIKESIELLYDAGISEEEVRSNMKLYVPPLNDFMLSYFTNKPNNSTHKDKWNGSINKVLDIEENLCCPQLGLKGKIDATLQVTLHERKGIKQEIVPLELKSGKASMSAEHRGQLVLYNMMLSTQRKEDPTTSEQRGLLLYLKDRVELREISCGYPERRDLVILRNQLVQYLANPQNIDSEQIVDIEDASTLLHQRLPEPINRESVCIKCPYLTICSLHLWHTDGPKVPETHPLSIHQDKALGHLSPEHIKYFLHWTMLLRMEERGQTLAFPLHSLWTDNVEKREKRGTCIANLYLKCVESCGIKFLHMFHQKISNSAHTNENNKDIRGPQEGEYCIVSLDDRPWIAAGVIVHSKNNDLHMLLERDLSQRLPASTSFHIDTYESYASTVQNLTNLGVLLDHNDRSQRLRRLIIDKEAPEFEEKLPREVGRIGTKLMRSLNIEQQRAVLRVIAAKDYALLRGLPGTGKTQTISVLIQMLVGLKQRVLVTAHTHSAVDTVLSRLPDSMRIMRLGAKSRVAENVVNRCEKNLVAPCNSVQELELLYNSMEVVGVTCLGAAHAMLTRTTFDVCIVDEATQVLQCTVLRPLFAAKRFVLVGDPEQLPPVVRSRAARRLGMEESLFHRLMREEATCTLQLQYRMNKPIADVANRVAYDGQLKCATDKVAHSRLHIDKKKISSMLDSAPWLSSACSPEPDLAVVFLDLKEQGSDRGEDPRTCTNKTEVYLVLALVDTLVQGGVPSSDIGVIAPYRDQVSLLKRSLSGQADVSTVDQFQGRDKPVIIYSCTKRDAQENRKVKEGEVLNDQRRLAVSVTRAKHKLIVLGDSRSLRHYEPLQRLIRSCTIVLLEAEDIHNIDRKYRTRIL